MSREAREAILEARESIREARKAIMEARRAEHDRNLDAIHTRLEARKAERDRRVAAVHAGIEARKAQQFAAKREQLQAELTREELKASKAAMMANVPTIQFPEDDPKYNSARKHEQA